MKTAHTVPAEELEAMRELQSARQHKMEATDRRNRRRMFHRPRRKPEWGKGGMYSRFRSGIRTGRTPHFQAWMKDLAIKSALQRTTIASIIDRHDDPRVAVAYDFLRSGGYKTVWDLTQASKPDLLRVKNFGPARLEQVKADLAKHHVAVKW